MKYALAVLILSGCAMPAPRPDLWPAPKVTRAQVRAMWAETFRPLTTARAVDRRAELAADGASARRLAPIVGAARPEPSKLLGGITK